MTAPGAGAAARPGASTGRRFAGRRRRKPRAIAVATAACSGCGGVPVCEVYCPVENCMVMVPDPEAGPGGRMWIDPLRCVGCRRCLPGGPLGTFQEGCPWDAIVMVPTAQWEAENGELPY